MYDEEEVIPPEKGTTYRVGVYTVSGGYCASATDGHETWKAEGKGDVVDALLELAEKMLV